MDYKKLLKVSVCFLMVLTMICAPTIRNIDANDEETQGQTTEINQDENLPDDNNDNEGDISNDDENKEDIKIVEKQVEQENYIQPMSLNPIYVKSDGNDTSGDGSFEKPFKTLSKAYSAVATGEDIYILDDIILTNAATFNDNKDITITSASSVDGTPITNGNQAHSIKIGAVNNTITLSKGSLTTTNIKFTSNISNIGRVLNSSTTNGALNINEGTSFYDLASSTYRGTAIYSTTLVNVNGNTNNPVTFNNVTSGKDYGVFSLYGSTAKCVINSVGDKGVIFDSCTTTSGGVIRMNSTSTLDIYGDTSSQSSVYFNKCISSNSQGGAISAAENTIINMNNVTFNECYAGGNGGAVAYSGDKMLTIKDCVFTCNTSSNRGGAVSSGMAVIDNCTFDNNTAQNGGAIAMSACTLTNSSFTNNTANNSGGGIFLILNNDKVANVSNCTFDNNTAVKSGGGINSSYDAANDSGTFNLVDCKVVNNKCTSTSGRGGGVYVSSNSNIKGCQIMNNESIGNGGGVYSYQGYYHRKTEITITDSDTKSTIISNNKAASGGGIFEMFISNNNNECSLNVEGNTNITNNIVSANGGGIASQSSVTGTTIDINVKGNTRIMGNSSADGNGGGIYQNKNTALNMSENAIISGNSCGAGKLGGGVYNVNELKVTSGAKFTIKDNVQILNNTSDHNESEKNNYAILNVDALSKNQETSHYGIYVAGALGNDAAIHVFPVHSEKGVLIATALDQSAYAITDSDQQKFYNDQMSNGVTGAYPIHFDTTNITGKTNNLILYGIDYTVEHYYGISSMDGRDTSSVADVTTNHTGNALSVASYTKKDMYGYRLNQVTYQNDVDSNEVATVSDVTVPNKDGLVIRLYYEKIPYNVTFQSSDEEYIKVINGDPQTVNYEEKASSGVTYKLEHLGQQFFTGWLYEMEVNGKKVTGVTMDYTTLAIKGNTKFTATYASVPFLSINAPIGGLVSIQKGNTEKYIEDGVHLDKFEFEKTDEGPYVGTGAFRAEKNYHISGITVIFPDLEGSSTSYNLDINNSSVQDLGNMAEDGSAKLNINSHDTYGTINIVAKSSAMIIIQYEEDPTYKVTYIANYSSTDNTVVNVKEGLHTGDTIGEAPTDSLYLPGYRLVGWSTDRITGADSSYVNDYDDNTQIENQDITYYAIWESKGQYEYDMLVYLEDENGNFVESSKYSTIRSVASANSWIYFNYDDGTTIKNEREIIGYSFDKANTSNVSSFYFDSTDPDLSYQHVILKSYYTLNKNDVHFVLNNGETDIIQAQINFGSKLTPPEVPSRTGYTFKGFYEDENFVNKADFDTFKMPNKEVSFYAKWKQNEYTVKYDTNGGNTIDDKTGVHFNDLSLLPTPPIKAGYTFVGWKDGDNDVTDATKYSDLVADDSVLEVTIVAQWTQNEYTVKYDTNGGNTIDDKTGVHFTDSSLLPTPPTKTGYTFAGWKVGDISVTDATKYSELVANDSVDDVTLIAQWHENDAVTIKYEAQNGGIVTNDKDTVSPVTGVPTGSNAVAKTGYTFKGWFKGDAKVSINASFTPSKENGQYVATTYTAKFEANTNTQYTVKYYLQDLGASTFTEETSARENATGKTDQAATSVKKSFKGFTYKEVKYATDDIEESTTVLNIAGDGSLVISYYYTRNSYTVKFISPDEGSLTATDTVKTQTVSFDGSPVGEVTVTSPNPASEYIWLGFIWKDTTNNTNGTIDASDAYKSFKVQGDTELTPYFAHIPFSSISTSGNGLVIASKSPDPELGTDTEKTLEYSSTGDNPDSIPYNSYMKFKANSHYKISSITIETPNGSDKTKHTIPLTDGVVADTDLPEGLLEEGGQVNLTLASDGLSGSLTINNLKLSHIVKINYEIITHKVEFDTQGGSTNPTNQTINDGDKTSKPVNPTKKGYTFDGWYTDKECTDTHIYDFNSLVTTDLKLYAKWIENEVTFTYASDNTTMGSVKPISEGIYSETVGAVNGNPKGSTATAKTGYEFVGWYVGSKKVSDNAEFKPTKNTEELYETTDYVAKFKKQKYNLTIHYVYEDNSIAHTDYTDSIDYQDSYNVPSPLIAGYTANPTTVSGQIGAEDKTITVKYVPNTNTAYTVEYYIQNIDESYPSTPEFSESKSGTTKTSPTFIKNKISGFSFDNNATTYEDSDTAASKTTLKIAADGSLVIRLYYTRLPYKITFDGNGAKNSNDYDDLTLTDKYQAVIENISGFPSDPIKPGYTFDGWGYVDQEGTMIIVDDLSKLPHYNIKLIAQWLANDPGEVDGNDKEYNVKDGQFTTLEILEFLDVKAYDYLGNLFDLEDLIVDQNQLDALNKAILDHKIGVYKITVIAPDGSLKVFNVTLVQDKKDDNKGDNGSNSNNGSNENKSTVDTGDHSNTNKYFELLGLSLMMGVLLLLTKKKNSKTNR